MLSDLHGAGKQWARLYAAAANAEGESVSASDEMLRQASEKVEGRLNKFYYTQLRISQELLRHSKRHGAKATFIAEPEYYPANPGKPIELTYHRLLSEKLAEWALCVSGFETVNDYAAVLMYPDFEGRPAQNKMDIPQAGRVTAEITIDNTKRTKALHNITLAVLDDKGRRVFETEPFSIGAAKSAAVQAEVYVPGDTGTGKRIFQAALMENGAIIAQRGLGLNVLDASLPESFLADVFLVPWAEEAIGKMTELGVIRGVGEMLFDPNASITREQFTKMVAELFDLPRAEGESSFADAEREAWYYESLVTAEKAGVINDRQGIFGVGEAMTRQDMALMLASALAYGGVALSGTTDAFGDAAEIAGYARDGVAGLAERGAIHGYEDGSFRPLDTATRAEAAQLLYNVYQIFDVY
jgi:hypothetical protein